MSGIYIPGIEMPERGNGFDITIYPDGSCISEDGLHYTLVPVPPHGRLIDADKLKLEIAKEDDGFGHDVYTAGIHDGFGLSFECIDEAPTIIPAEEGEG